MARRRWAAVYPGIDKDCQRRQDRAKNVTLPMPTQNVNLTPALEAFVKRQVSLGHFNNVSEVHRSALSAMARREEERALQLEQLRREIQLGIEDVEAGRSAKIASVEGLGSMLDGYLEKAIMRLELSNAEPTS